MFMLLWKNIERRRTQSLLTVTITLLTVMVFVMVMGVMQVMQSGLELSRQRLGADAVLIPKYAPTHGEELLFTASPQNIYMKASVLEDAKNLPGIAKMSPQFYAQSLELGCCEPGEVARIIGFDPETDFVLAPHLEGIDIKTLTDDELIEGANFSDEGDVGNSLLLLGRKFHVPALLLPTGSGMDSTFFMKMDVCRQLCLENPVLKAGWQNKDPFEYISVIMIKLEPDMEPETFAKIVEDSGIDAKCVLTGATISTLQSQLEVTMDVLIILWFASMLIAVLSLFGRFNALAKDRKKEIGLLRAIGVERHQVFGLIIGECCLMAVIGGILGSVLALLSMDFAIDYLKDAFMLSPSVWNTSLALICSAAGVLMAAALGFVSAFAPAVRSASLDPQVAITQGEV